MKKCEYAENYGNSVMLICKLYPEECPYGGFQTITGRVVYCGRDIESEKVIDVKVEKLE